MLQKNMNRNYNGKVQIQGDGEKIIRMSGKSSDVSDYTIDRFGIYNFLLIYET